MSITQDDMEDEYYLQQELDNWPLLWSRIFEFSETAQPAEAAELFKCTFS